MIDSTLVQSSATTRRWVGHIQSKVSAARPKWGYRESLYWATFSVPPKEASIAQLNVLKNSIRVFLRLDPSSEMDLRKTVGTKSFARWMRSMWVLGSEDGINRASELIVLSGDTYP